MKSAHQEPSVVDSYPLSPLQHGMLFHQLQFGRSTGVDIEQLEVSVPHEIDPAIFFNSWRLAAERHPILRTRFAWQDRARPEQQVLSHVEPELALEDLRSLPSEEQTALVTNALAEDRRRGFDLGSAPLWRVTLWRTGKATYRMVWTYAHAILDGCYAEVVREVFDGHDALRRGQPFRVEPRPSYRDHVVWLDRELRSRTEEARTFWRSRLAGFTTPTGLETLRRTDAHPAASHDTVRFHLAPSTSDAIRRAATDLGVRPYSFVEAAWALVLAAFSGEDDVVFGSTRACRRSSVPGAEVMLGLFINTVPVRIDTSHTPSLPSLLRELRIQQTAVQRFEHTPLVDVLACTDLPRGASLFETIIVFNDHDNDARFKSWGGRWATCDVELHDQTNFPMNVMVYDEPAIAFKLSYDREQFSRDAVERVADLLTRLLEAMAARPDAPLGHLPRLPALDEITLATFNDTAGPVPSPSCVHEAFEAQVDRTPDAVALVCRGRSLTYRELDERANRVARELRALGVGPDAMVGVYVERSLELVIGLLGILKAGGAYVPMDPSYPLDRIRTMLVDTQSSVVLTVDRLRRALPASNATLLSLDTLVGERLGERPRPGTRPEHLAYVIFTSGSAGRPKGVQIEHRQVANFFGAMDRTLGTSPGVWLALTSVSFDISVLELFWTLTRGFTVILQEEADHQAATERRQPPRARPVGFSLFYFAADAGDTAGDKYRLLLEGAQFADAHDFEAVWTPERHFHPFGGLYPNPAITGAAVAMVTTRVGIRAGSIVLPLHHPIRCAEEWSVVDNLSKGRVGLSFASGWHATDFALAPDHFKDRRELMARGIETVRALWRGDAVAATSGDGSSITVKIFPPPIQSSPRIWLTASGNPDTFVMAGRLGASILTNVLVMNRTELAANIAVYRRAYREAGHPGDGHVTLMLHTFVGDDVGQVRALVREPFLAYLRTSTDLVNKARWERTAFAKADDRVVDGTVTKDLDELSPEDMNAILNHAVERYMSENGLFGTPESCVSEVERLRDVGVDEIACLIDFGLDADTVLAGLHRLDALRRLCARLPAATAEREADLPAEVEGEAGSTSVADHIRRHGVTHLQCTPSLLGLLMLDDQAVDALASLQQLLVGGEALPPPLLARLGSRGSLGSKTGVTVHNMYGPTETTIWSTTAIVSPERAITIGRPVANTTIRIVGPKDPHRRPVPIGVPGELLIGGMGVARGYLDRPELTAERFVVDEATGGRFYRTGDLARWLPTGEIEFLGRLDQQMKIRGHRVEPGEVESVLIEHPAVRQAAVVPREGPTGDTRLVAYVVPHASGADADWGGATAGWRTIWDQTYRTSPPSETDLDTAGWVSSLTGRSIPDAEMREWADATAARTLSAVGPASDRPRILEIGCGTGMIVSRVAPACSAYVGVDLSGEALARLRSQLERRADLRHVALEQRAAHELEALQAQGPFDVIVLNSVVQYFPDAHYLERVLTEAYARLAPGGAILVGDVRSLAHLPTLHASIELARADGAARAADVHALVGKRLASEGELVFDPRFFEQLAASWHDARVERAEVKRGRAWNEMTAFRYDVIIRKVDQTTLLAVDAVRDEAAPSPCSLDRLARLLDDEPAALRVMGVPNRRLVAAVRATTLLATSPDASVADLRAAAQAASDGVDPDEVRALHPGYDVRVEFSATSLDRMDVCFWRRRGVAGAGPGRERRVLAGPTEAYTNRPVRPSASGEPSSTLVASLRDHARLKLPEFMVPSAFVIVQALPLTPNGKIDRRALPAAEAVPSAPRALEPPSGDLERAIVTVLQELVGGAIGADDNFFDAGANSLLMVQASVRLATALGRAVPLMLMFQHPSARALAATLSRSSDEAVSVAASQDRAQIRRAALGRRRGTAR